MALVAMIRPRLAIIPVMLLVLAGAWCCRRSVAEPLLPSQQVNVPALFKASDGSEVMELKPGDVPGMTFAKVESVALPEILQATGQVSFDESRVATIVTRVGGRVDSVWVSKWDSVKKGQPIVAIFSPDYMTAVAEYLQAIETVRFSGEATEAGDLARQMMVAARHKLELIGVDPADIEKLKTATPRMVMRAPIRGIVIDKKVVRGSQVSPGDVLFTVGTLDEVWITANIYEEELARVHVGQKLEAITTAFPDTAFAGTITRISPNVDPQTHTIQIRCQVRNIGNKLKPDMLARIRIVTKPGSATVVPQEALVFDTNDYYAFVLKGNNRVTRRKVKIAAWNEEGYARVISGLKPGEQVIKDESLQVDALWQRAHERSS